jgi:protein-L-isoaspartate(D-aspartate) O-methyltransferase
MDEPGQRASEARDRMVAEQLRARGIVDHRVLDAMAAVPRDAFVEGTLLAEAYADRPLPIGAGQTISQPYIVARMTELLAVRPGDRILDVGTGSGYQAAILAQLGCVVTSIDRDPALADDARDRLAALGFGARVTVVTGDGSLGRPQGAPWDGIVVAAAAPKVPTSLKAQLADGGRLVIPVGGRREQQLLVLHRRGDTWLEHADGPCVFVPLIGEQGWRA